MKGPAKSGRVWAWILLPLFLLAAGLLAHRSLGWVRGRPDFLFDPRKVDLGELRPAWLQRPMARAFFSSYLEVAGQPFSLLDQEALEAFAERVRGLPWVRRLAWRRELPDRCELDLELRRPVAAAVDAEGAWWLLDHEGRLLPLKPASPSELPPLPWGDGTGLPVPGEVGGEDLPPFGLPLLLGTGPVRTGSRAFRDGAGIAALVTEKTLPWVRGKEMEVPDFLGVDLSNSGLSLLVDRAEYRLLFRSSDRRPVYLAWGHAPGGAFLQIPWQEKAEILLRLLRAFTGLSGIRAADLRFPERWRDRVVLFRGESR